MVNVMVNKDSFRRITPPNIRWINRIKIWKLPYFVLVIILMYYFYPRRVYEALFYFTFVPVFIIDKIALRSKITICTVPRHFNLIFFIFEENEVKFMFKFVSWCFTYLLEWIFFLVTGICTIFDVLVSSFSLRMMVNSKILKSNVCWKHSTDAMVKFYAKKVVSKFKEKKDTLHLTTSWLMGKMNFYVAPFTFSKLL